MVSCVHCTSPCTTAPRCFRFIPSSRLRMAFKFEFCSAWKTVHDDAIECICIHPNGRYLASGGKDCKLIIWDTASATSVHHILASSAVKCLVWWGTQPNDMLLCGTEDGTLFSIRFNEVFVQLSVPSAPFSDIHMFLSRRRIAYRLPDTTNLRRRSNFWMLIMTSSILRPMAAWNGCWPLTVVLTYQFGDGMKTIVCNDNRVHATTHVSYLDSRTSLVRASDHLSPTQ